MQVPMPVSDRSQVYLYSPGPYNPAIYNERLRNRFQTYIIYIAITFPIEKIKMLSLNNSLRIINSCLAGLKKCL
uniref:Uncharacterized protein n=1 Tax=Acrobeloides nanus TaxID=290746 RepID=A0A914EQ74_9BILA